jgi:hypothetical protein
MCRDVVLNEENYGDQHGERGRGEKNKERDRKFYV